MSVRNARSSIGVLAVLVWCLGLVADVQAQYRIMPVGDSITVGYTDNPTWSVPYEFGYRSGLYTLLNNAQASGGFPFQFVGNSTEPFNGAYGLPTNTPNPDLRTVNQDHSEGYGGVGTSFVAGNMSNWLTVDHPDVVLLMIGINDIGAGSSVSPVGAETNLNNIVNTVVTQSPNARLIVAQITPYTTYTPAIVQYNDYIRNVLVPSYDALGKHVSTVDQYANFGSGTSVDSSLYSNGFNHPNATGYAAMAQTWFNGIQALNLPPIAPAPVNLVQNGSFEQPVFGNGTHNVNPSGSSWSYTTSTVAGAGSGIDHGDPYGAGNGSASEGAQQAFLQSSGDGSVTSISQAVSGFLAGHTYSLSFDSKAIQGFQGANPFQVEIIDGANTLHLFGGQDITPVTDSYTHYTTQFTATNTTLTVEFFDHGLNTFQKVSWIDNVQVTAVPEPATLLLSAIGGLSLLIVWGRGRTRQQ